MSVGTFYSIFFLRFDISQGPGDVVFLPRTLPRKSNIKTETSSVKTHISLFEM